MSSRQLRKILRTTDRHWVGDGFPVRTLFSYADSGTDLSPFLLLDYAGPLEFSPTHERRGVGGHPHRGFETVTIVYAGEVEHRDSSGGGGKIGPGDVQWMTAGAGIVHQEFHGSAFGAQGGNFEMVQLWVNLPARDKLTAPRYQGIVAGDIPLVTLPTGQGVVRVIAGEFADVRGPALTFTPLQLWDIELAQDQQVDFALPDGFTTAIFVLSGALRCADSGLVGTAELGLFERAGDSIRIDVVQDTRALLLCAEPIDEPIVGLGPFVMNSEAEIRQAMADFRNGRMGHL